MAPSALPIPTDPLEALRELLPADAFSETELGEMVPLCAIEHLEQGAVLIREDEPSDNRVYFLLGGSVSVYIQERFILRLKTRGDTVGEMGLISAAPRSATVRTDEPSSFLVVHAALSGEAARGTDYKFRYFLSRLFNSILTEKLRRTSHRARLYEELASQSEAAERQRHLLQADIARYLQELNLYTHLVDSARDAILVADTAGKVLSANESLRRTFGVRSEDVIGVELSSLLGLSDRGAESWTAIAGQARHGGWHGEVTLYHAQEGAVPADCAVSAVHDRGREHLAYSVILRDSRERKAYEQRLLEQSRALERANEELTALDRAKNNFLSLVSHQLRTPITAIQAYAETLSTEGMVEPAEQASFIEVIHEEAAKLAEMVNKVLAISKIQSGQMLFQFRKDRLDELVRAQVVYMRPQAEARHLEITFEVREPAEPVVFDEDQLREAVRQLLDNAINFSDTGSISVRFSQNGKESLIEVSDTGKGIQGNEIQAQLEMFSRGDTNNTSNYGLGLGLPLCYLIIKAHSGELRLEGRSGKGTTVSMTLPYQPAAAAQAH